MIDVFTVFKTQRFLENLEKTEVWAETCWHKVRSERCGDIANWS